MLGSQSTFAGWTVAANSHLEQPDLVPALLAGLVPAVASLHRTGGGDLSVVVLLGRPAARVPLDPHGHPVLRVSLQLQSGLSTGTVQL